MRVPDIFAPLSGALATISALGLVGIYAHGRSLPAEHRTTVSAVLAAPPEVASALLTDLKRRPEWRPRVARIGRIEDAMDGRAVWRELDPGGDRFDFVVDELGPDRLVIEVAQPVDLGFRARWIWQIEPSGTGSRVEVTEEGIVDNLFFRGWWSLVYGPYAAIEEDLAAFCRALGSPVAPVREP